MKTCPRCESVTFGKHDLVVYVYIDLITGKCICNRIQGHCNSGQECPLLHPAREDDDYVPLHPNNAVCTYTIGWIVLETSHIHMLSSETMGMTWTKRQENAGSFGIMKVAEMILAISLMKT